MELVICTICHRLCFDPADWYTSHRYGVMGDTMKGRENHSFTRLWHSYGTWKKVLNGEWK